MPDGFFSIHLVWISRGGTAFGNFHLQRRSGQRIIGNFNRLSGSIERYQDTSIWGIFDDGELAFRTDGTNDGISFEKLILCEGACERTVPFPGWTLPGIMTLGGLQKFVHHQRVLPGKRVLLSGSGPLLLAVAAESIGAVRKQHLDLNAIKKRTRLGMGPCQGKVCEAIAAELSLKEGVALPDLSSMTIRPPITPIPMSAMARPGRTEKGT